MENMIYLEEKFNLLPASPITLETYVNLAQNQLVPICERLGTRIVGAWYSNSEWFSQVTQIVEFDNMDGLKEFRMKTSRDSAWGKFSARLEELAPERRSRILEPLGPVEPKILDKAIRRSKKKPLKVYLLATLEVAPDKMPEFKTALKQAKSAFPIIASWRPIGGSPNEVIDLWRTNQMIIDSFISGYKSPDDLSRQFYTELRKIAPKEHAELVFTLPYGELK
jgi:hypothetical protein